MATISKIRRNSGIVIFIIGLALVAFIVSDAIQNNQFLLEDRETAVGVIAGEEIEYTAYDALYQQNLTNFRNQMKGAELNEQQLTQISDQTWNQLVQERTLGTEYDRLGLEVTEDELLDLLTENPDPQVRQIFTNPETGQFESERVIYFLQNFDQQPAEVRQSWLQFEDFLVQNRIRQKYFTLIRQSQFVTDLEARRRFIDDKRLADVNYLMLPLTLIPDTTVKVDESELQAYYEENQEDFDRELQRSIEFVSFPISPSAEDTQAVEQYLAQRQNAFATAANDSLFLRSYSEVPLDTTWKRIGTVPAAYATEAWNADSGDVIGPFLVDGRYHLVKVKGFRQDTIKSYRASHILVRPEAATDADSAAALEEARGLRQRILAGESFEQLARQFSEDPSNAPQGGDLGWFTAGTMVKPFSDAVARADEGDIVVVETQFGAHVIKVTEKAVDEVARLAVLQRSITPSSRTRNAIYNEAIAFRSQFGEQDEEFRATASEAGETPRIIENVQPNARSVVGIPAARPLVRWVYEAEQGAISEPIDLNDQYVVARVTDVFEKGPAPFAQVEEEVRQAVIRQKQKEILESRIAEASEGAESLPAIAEQLDAEVRNAAGLSFSTNIVPNVGNEPRFLGTAFGLEPGLLPPSPVEGNNGVFQLVVESFTDVEVPEDLTQTRQPILSDQEGRAQFETMEALRKAANVEDLRYKFY